MFDLIEKQDMNAIASYLIVRMALILVCWSFVCIAIIFDFWSGRATSKALGEKLDSKGYRRTFVKIGDYYRVLMFLLLFDLIGSLFDFYKLPFATILGSIATIAIELKSVIENSRRKKSHAGDMPEIIKEIIQCTTADKSKKILDKLVTELKENKK